MIYLHGHIVRNTTAPLFGETSSRNQQKLVPKIAIVSRSIRMFIQATLIGWCNVNLHNSIKMIFVDKTATSYFRTYIRFIPRAVLSSGLFFYTVRAGKRHACS